LEQARAASGWRGAMYRLPLVGAIAYVISPPRTKAPSLLRRTLSWTSLAVAAIGVGMVAYPVWGAHYPGFYRVPVERAIEWTNVLSDLHANNLQEKLKKRFVAVSPARPAAIGEPLTRLEIPKLGVDTIVVEGTSLAALKAGAGHYPQTPLPGAKGNVSIAGHRTTYGRPFNRVEELKPGDKIILTTPVGVYTYEVARAPWITSPEDFAVIGNTPDAVLTLTSCHPKGSARQRIIVRAKLIASKAVTRKATAQSKSA
jgi:LPXTG-site transpeptidase (sortase) family protein